MTAPPRSSAARERAMLVARNGATFPQALFVKLRRAGWPVSPVLEGRVQIGGRSFRLLGIEPVTLPAEVGNAPTIGKASLQTFITPPGQTLVAPDTLGDLRLAEGASPSASNGTALPPLQAQPQLVPDVLVVDIGIGAEAPEQARIRSRACWSASRRARARRWKASRATCCAWSSPMPRPISSG